jgi:SAM-dependent methyltransferase
MAIDLNTAKFLVTCRRAGMSFTRTLTLGRQRLFLAPKATRNLLEQFGQSTPELEATLAKGDGYVDGLFELLGTKELVSVDFSGYEGASLIHDMNLPLSADHVGQFDLVFDGGTLEHIFNFPCAIRSCMELVKVGGHLLLHTPTNNWCGHGFYQFSPELFFRVLSAENGYHVERMIAFEFYPNSQLYEVTDPKHLGSRVELTHSNHQVLLLVLAKRLHATDMFRHPPQQSDYVSDWEIGRPRRDSEKRALRKALRAWSEGRLLRALIKRSIALTGSENMVDAYDNRRLSLKGQSKVFRPISE